MPHGRSCSSSGSRPGVCLGEFRNFRGHARQARIGGSHANSTAVRVRASDQHRPRNCTAGATWAGGTARCRRAQPAADDETSSRPTRASDRHQRSRPVVRPHRRRRDPHRCHDPAPRVARIGGRQRALRDLRRGRAGDRRSDRAQPRNRRWVAVSGRSVRGPVGRHVGVGCDDRAVLQERRTYGSGARVPPRARTRRPPNRARS